MMHKKKQQWICLLMLMMFSFTSVAWAAEESDGDRQEGFRVVGYYSQDLFDEPVDNLQMDKLTHIMYAFLIPNADGTIMAVEKPEQLEELVTKAHANGVKVFASIGGWSYQNEALAPRFEILAETKESRQIFIDHVLAIVDAYQLDGIELDWEYPEMTSGKKYEDLVLELSDALAKEDKELTAALNGAWAIDEGPEVSKIVSDKCLDALAFINVMAYDMNNENHSPLWFAETSIKYYTQHRQMPKEKVVLGMPLYAHPSWMQYRHLIQANPDYAYTDYAPPGDYAALPSYYNGLNTLREKTALAYRIAGGVMLFDVNEDTNDEFSVLSMIEEVIDEAETLGDEVFDKSVMIFLNDRPLTFLASEQMGHAFIDENGRTLIPLRKTLQAIGAEVTYHQEDGLIEIHNDDTVVCVSIDSPLLSINGTLKEMDTQAVIKEGRTYIPARAVLEAFGYRIEWHGVSQSVYINEQ